eukprot:5698439-Ditylum_brightwellii.AAC.1
MEISKRFEIADEGETIEEYLEIKIDHNQDGTFRMYQPILIERIIASIPEMDRAKEREILAETPLILTNDTNGSNRKEHWNYRSVIVIRYLLSTRKGQKNEAPKFGLNIKPDLTKGLE